MVKKRPIIDAHLAQQVARLKIAHAGPRFAAVAARMPDSPAVTWANGSLSYRELDDAATRLADGTAIDGHEGLRHHLLTVRRDAFVRQFCRKLLGYALGRAVQLSDEPLLDAIAARLAADGHRVHVAIEAIVSSPQFRTIRGADAADDGE
jgi:hypothetical protein